MGPPQNFVWTLAQCARAYFREAPASAQEGLDLHVVLHNYTLILAETRIDCDY